MTDPDWQGFRRAPDGVLCFDGYAVFGHILPRIMVENFACYADGSPVEETGETSAVGAYQRKALVVEWLGQGCVVAFGAPRLR